MTMHPGDRVRIQSCRDTAYVGRQGVVEGTTRGGLVMVRIVAPGSWPHGHLLELDPGRLALVEGTPS